ncbi:neurobeachin-like protein 2 [Ischnura elegans]|uniref:neurobeachin-like protein 2 n=1 Tax=Ischnura elegans TaxID=197161 RepID=UPI001ED8BB4C|nr:neurobeachin-like protein 2 [Ischnura elegans]
METPAVLLDQWTKYISSNDEKTFHSFINDFVSYWESQLNIEYHDPIALPSSWMWNLSSSEVKSDDGPHLSALPDELLPALAKFIFLAKDETEKDGLDVEGLKKLEKIIRCLIIICRNFDNIPFVASCEYVSLIVGIAAAVIHQELSEEGANEATKEQLRVPRAQFLSCFCCFLECLYDPYLTWRDFIKGSPQPDPCNLPLHSALLHMEVIPFIYDCFQTSMMKKMPWLCSDLIHILGGTISAAQHNGLRAICPATINILMDVIANADADESVCAVAFKCFIIMAHVLQKSPPEERQVELGMILQLYHTTINTLCTQMKTYEKPKILFISISTLGSLLDVSDRVHSPLQDSLINSGFPELIVSVLEENKEFSSSAQQKLAVISVNSLTKLLSGNVRGKEKFSKAGGYDQLFNALLSIGKPSDDLLKALFLMAVDGRLQNYLQNIEVVMFLLQNLNVVEASRQKKVCSSLHQICISHFLSKEKACRNGVISGICKALSCHADVLSQEAAVELVAFLEDLLQHTVTPLELKKLFYLLRPGESNSDQLFPYRSHVLQALYSAARKGNHIDCNCYLDVQSDTDGIAVPGIKKWPGIGNCLAFHAWVRLEAQENNGSSTKSGRRQLFSFYTSGGSGFEIFFASSGDLTVAVSSNKYYSAATVSDIPLTDGQWHSLYICHMAARRPFGQNHLTVSIDGTQRLSACLKFPSLTDPYIYCHIGSIVQRSGVVGGKKVSGKGENKDEKESDAHVLPKAIYSSLTYLVPGLMQGPIGSLHPQQDPPHVKSVPAGAQDSVWGPPTCLKGHLGQVALFHDCLSNHQIKMLHSSGPDYWAVNAVDDTMELTDFTNRLVLCYSPSACWKHNCPDLAPGGKHNGHVEGTLCCTQTVKDALNGIGGVLVLHPLLENAVVNLDKNLDENIPPTPSPRLSQEKDKAGSEEFDGWEVLPHSSFSDWKLEQNPVSGYLTLLRNIITRSALNQESVLKSNSLAIIGYLLIKTKAELIDVNVLMAVQLLVEMAHDSHSGKGNPGPLLQAIHRHLLFDFRIWSRSQFQIRIGHLQYVSTVVKEDRRYFRKNYGVQFLLDVIRRHYNSESMVDTSEDGVLLCAEDLFTVRRALLGLIKYFMQKDVNVREVYYLLGFLVSVRDESLVSDCLDMLISIVGNKKCRDQIFLLLYERHAADILYGLIVDKIYSMELKQKVLRVMSVLLRTDRVRERNKRHLRLQDMGPNHGNSSTVGLYPGLVSLWQDQGSLTPSMEVVMMLMDQMLSTDSPGGYAGCLSLLSVLSLHEDLSIRIEAARKTLTTIFMVPAAAKNFAMQVGWQECISRLLIRKPINGATDGGDELGADLMSFGEDHDKDEDSAGAEKDDIIAVEVDDEYEVPLSSLPRLANSVTDAAYYIENEVKEVAGNVTSAVADNIYSAADNISSAVASAYSVIRQKTLDMQGPLSPRSSSPRFFQRSPFSLSSFRGDFDGVSLEKRSQSCSSEEEEESSAVFESRDSTAGDTVSLASALSISNDTGVVSEDDKGTEGSTKTEELEGTAMDDEAVRILKELDEEKVGDKEDELCYLVVNILFTILWRGVEGSGKDAWKERGQVLSCINLVGLNNELLSSHLELRRSILELALTASLSDLRSVSVGSGQPGSASGDSVGGSQSSASAQKKTEAAKENAAFLMYWVYDLVVLDPNEDGSKKASIKLLNGVLGHLEILLVFQDGARDEWTEMAKITLGILLTCAASDDLEICAMATAKLHALVQTRTLNNPDEGGFILYSINKILCKDIERNCQDRYSFLIPVVKALLEKLSPALQLKNLLPELPKTQAGPVFYEEFRSYCQSEEWTSFVENTVRGLHDGYRETLAEGLTDTMNTYWAECYEASKLSSNKRIKEVAESRVRFEGQIMDYYRSRQIEDIARFSNLLNQEKNHDLLVGRKWHHLKHNLISLRGAWRESFQGDLELRMQRKRRG